MAVTRTAPCWVLMRSDGTEWDNGDYAPHFRTEDEAANEAEVRELADVKVAQLEHPCLIVSCGCCHETFDEEGEGHTVHFESGPDPQVLIDAEWTHQDDDSYRCLPCSPGGDCDCREAAAAREQGGEVFAR